MRQDHVVGIAVGVAALALASVLHLAVIGAASRRLGPASMVGLRMGRSGPENEMPWKVVRPVFVALGLAIPVVSGIRLAGGSSAGGWELAGAVVITVVVTVVEWVLVRSAAEDQSA